MARSPEQNSAYMKAYYQKNKSKWKRTKEQQDKANKAKRKAYRERPEIANWYKQAAKSYRRKNPTRRRQTELKTRYNLTQRQYEEMLELQGHACAICLTPFLKATPNVDHCHSSGFVRGLLCADCNLAIGKLKDCPDRLIRAAQYLKGRTNVT